MAKSLFVFIPIYKNNTWPDSNIIFLKRISSLQLTARFPGNCSANPATAWMGGIWYFRCDPGVFHWRPQSRLCPLSFGKQAFCVCGGQKNRVHRRGWSAVVWICLSPWCSHGYFDGRPGMEFLPFWCPLSNLNKSSNHKFILVFKGEKIHAGSAVELMSKLFN